MKYLGFLLHCYQPPWQDKYTLSRMCRRCYRPLFEWILESEVLMTLNINFSLIELLHTHNHKELLKLIKMLANSSHVELTGSGAYHPILPLVPPSECKRQIHLNEDGFKQILRIDLPKKGFFPPEMSCDEKTAAMVKNAGYSWLIMDDQSFVQRYGYAPFNFVPSTNGLPVILQSNHWSNSLAFKKISTALGFYNELQNGLNRWFGDSDGYLIMALDGETFGGHENTAGYLNFLKRLCELINKNGIRLMTVSQIVALFPKKEMAIPSGSWSTSKEDAARGVYYPLWQHPENKLHQALWELIGILLPYVDEEDITTCSFMDKALNSCQFWWLTPDHWNPANAFRTIPIYQDIIRYLKLPDSEHEKIKKIFQTLESATGLKIPT